MFRKAFLPFALVLLLAGPAGAAGVVAAGTAANRGPGNIAGESAPAAATPGQWREHELRFTYSGFTTKYSCDGLADKLRGLLRSLGARPDMKVMTFGCASLAEGPTEFPGVKLRFAALEPAAAVAGEHVAASEAPAVAGLWRRVRLDRDRPRPLEAGDCELLEQFRDRVLPLFTLRGMDDHTRCIPNQLSGANLALSFEVFAPLASGDAARAGHR